MTPTPKTIRAWMKAYKVKPAELASDLGVSSSTLQNILAGKHVAEPTMRFLEHLMALPRPKLKQ